MKYGFVVVVDTREQRPFRFPPDVQTASGTLATGDYSVQGFEEQIALERKSLPDLLACIVGKRANSNPNPDNRARFQRELRRLGAYQCRGVLIEANVDDLFTHDHHCKVHPNAVIGSLSKWSLRYRVPFWWCGSAGPQIALSLMHNYIQLLRDALEALPPTYQPRLLQTG